MSTVGMYSNSKGQFQQPQPQPFQAPGQQQGAALGQLLQAIFGQQQGMNPQAMGQVQGAAISPSALGQQQAVQNAPASLQSVPPEVQQWWKGGGGTLNGLQTTP